MITERILTDSTWEWAIASNRCKGRQLGSFGLAAFLCLGLLWSAVSHAAVYLTAEEFLQASFSQSPVAKTMWLKEPQQRAAKLLLGHAYQGLRLRYWVDGQKSAWILDEIGKEEPITIGVVILDDLIQDVKILSYRESRGWEVRHPFFTDQFKGLSLKSNRRLSERIDGISGATLSVRAVTNVSRFALLLHQQIMTENDI
jgi:hypothetical protein